MYIFIHNVHLSNKKSNYLYKYVYVKQGFGIYKNKGVFFSYSCINKHLQCETKCQYELQVSSFYYIFVAILII